MTEDRTPNPPKSADDLAREARALLLEANRKRIAEQVEKAKNRSQAHRDLFKRLETKRDAPAK